jgi:hypothetical protein
MSFVHGLADQGSGFSHGGKDQNVHLLENAPDIAAALTNVLECLDISQSVDLFHRVQMPLGPGMVDLRRFVEEGF